MRISAGGARNFDSRNNSISGANEAAIYRSNRAGDRVATKTGTTVLDGAREDANNRSNRTGGDREAFNNRNNIIGWTRVAVNNNSNSIGGQEVLEGLVRLLTTTTTVLKVPERLLTAGATVPEGQRRCLQHENQCWGGGGAREVGNRRRSAWEARDFDNMNKSIVRDNDAVNNRSNSIGVAMGIVFLVSLYIEKANKALDALRYMQFCEQAVRLYMVSLERLCKQTCAGRI